jgi:hypothetical protein
MVASIHKPAKTAMQLLQQKRPYPVLLRAARFSGAGAAVQSTSEIQTYGLGVPMRG